MSTIAENLQRLINAKAAIKAAIEAKGGVVSDDATLGDLATAISAIEAGGDNSDLMEVKYAIANLLNSWYEGDYSENTDTYTLIYALQNAISLGTAGYINDKCTEYNENYYMDYPTSTIKDYIDALEDLVKSRYVNGNPDLEMAKAIITDMLNNLYGGSFSGNEDIDDILYELNRAIEVDTYRYLLDKLVVTYNYRPTTDTVPSLIDALENCAKSSSGGGISVDLVNLLLSKPANINNPSTGNLAWVELPEGITKIGNYGLSNWAGVEAIKLPSTMTRIGNYAFQQCSGLKYIYCTAITPPTASSSSFSGASIRNVYVPDTSVNDYKAATGWSGLGSKITKISTAARTFTPTPIPAA